MHKTRNLKKKKMVKTYKQSKIVDCPCSFLLFRKYRMPMFTDFKTIIYRNDVL